MPTLPTPPAGAGLSGGDLPVTDGSSVLAEFSDTHKRPVVAPVRDDLCAAFAVSHSVYQDTAAQSLAQCDPLRSKGDFLVSRALEQGIIPTKGETEASIRARLFAAPEIVTPQAIVNQVNAILAPATNAHCRLVELELDGLFIHDGTVTAWDSFIGVPPRYPSRYYIYDSAENDGFYLTDNVPDGSLVSMGLSRNFHLILPPVDAADEDFAFITDFPDENTNPDVNDHIHVFSAIDDGTGSYGTYIFADGRTADEIYAAIVGIVESIKGQGISWSAFVDPELT